MAPLSPEQRFSLSLLLGKPIESGLTGGLKPDRFWRFARKNTILVRCFNRLSEGRSPLVTKASGAEAAAEKKRISETVRLIQTIHELCVENGIEFLFSKSFQHLPDMGHDVDLLVLDRSEKIDRLIEKRLRGSQKKGSLIHRTAGKSSFDVAGSPSPLEIHHGRMGLVGEHADYPGHLIENRRMFAVCGILTFVPSPSDQLIIQVIQRVYCHLTIRISDVVQTLNLLGSGDLDWNYIESTSKKMGILGGLVYYLDRIKSICRSAFDARLGEDLHTPSEDDLFRVPFLLVLRNYSQELARKVAEQRWQSAARLSLLPPLAAIGGLRNLAFAFSS